MIQCPGCFGFLLEPLNQLIAVRSIAIDRNGLEGDGPFNELVVRFVDAAHGATSHFLLDLVAAHGVEAGAARLAQVSIGRLIRPQQFVDRFGAEGLSRFARRLGIEPKPRHALDQAIDALRDENLRRSDVLQHVLRRRGISIGNPLIFRAVNQDRRNYLLRFCLSMESEEALLQCLGRR